MRGDLQLVVPNVPTDSFDKGEIDYELILQVPYLHFNTQLLHFLKFLLVGSPKLKNGFNTELMKVQWKRRRKDGNLVFRCFIVNKQ